MKDTVRLGKFAAKSSTKALLFEDFLKTDVEVPSSYNFWANRAKFPSRLFGNNIYGNCTRASQAEAAMHMERIETKQTPTITDAEVVRVYFEMTWRRYGDSDNGAKPMPAGWTEPQGEGDQGAYETDALSDWRRPEYTFKDTKGRPLTIDAYTRINHLDQDAIRRAIYITGGHGIKLCFNLPAAWANQPANWNAAPTGTPLIGVWMPGSWGGHSTYGESYASSFSRIKTWGEMRYVNWEALAIYCDEAHWVVDSLDAWRKKPAAKVINFNKIKEAVNDVSAFKIAA